ncbi:hypothetical protein SLS54_002841 [Diplodia seriata]
MAWSERDHAVPPTAHFTKNPVDRTIENADSYVYYAMHIYLEEKCNRDFKLPQDASDN